MKYVQKENRVEAVNDTDLPEYEKRGWREIDPKTGVPVVKGSKDETAVLKDDVKRLQKQLRLAEEKIRTLTEENCSLKPASEAKEPNASADKPAKSGRKTKDKAANEAPDNASEATKE